jgi:hypothetical protein
LKKSFSVLPKELISNLISHPLSAFARIADPVDKQ